MNSKLNYCTENGHEFYVEANKNTAIINCIADNDAEIIGNPIQPSDLKEMIETAKTHGIEFVELHTNFGIDVHTHTLKTAKSYNNLSIVKTETE
jgi:pyridoxine 5'-phosphate synthase PdxJ